MTLQNRLSRGITRLRVRRSHAHQRRSLQHFDGHERISRYLSLSDGRRVAVDVLRPTLKGTVVEEPLPVLLTQTPYNRAASLVQKGRVVETNLFKVPRVLHPVLRLRASKGELVADHAMMYPWLGSAIKSGFVVVAVDLPGTGASFGVLARCVDDFQDDGIELMDWISGESWCDGSVVVFGQSFAALTALSALASHHNALRGAVMASVPLRPYESVGYDNGDYLKGFGENYIAVVSDLDLVATPVDSDTDRSELQSALNERQHERFVDQITDLFGATPDTDKASPRFGLRWSEVAGERLLAKAKQCSVPSLVIAGWNDIFLCDSISAAAQLDATLVIRPVHHRPLLMRGIDMDPAVEIVDWLHRQLSNDTAIPDSSTPVRYYSLSQGSGARGIGTWRHADHWPIDGTPTPVALTAGRGSPSPTVRIGAGTTGINSRWNGILGSGKYTPMIELNPDSPFWESTNEEPTNAVGTPIVTLLLDSAPLRQIRLHAVLESVTRMQPSYLTEGTVIVESSCRQVTMTLLPIAFSLRLDTTLRLTVLGADTNNYAARQPTDDTVVSFTNVGLEIPSRDI